MDPQATLNLMSECTADEDWVTLGELADSLMTWLVNDGFQPAAMVAQLQSILACIPVEQTSTRDYVASCITIAS